MFGYKAPNEQQQRVCIALRTHFYNLGRVIVANTPSGRAQAVALAELQRATWAALAAAVEASRVDGSSLG